MKNNQTNISFMSGVPENYQRKNNLDDQQRKKEYEILNNVFEKEVNENFFRPTDEFRSLPHVLDVLSTSGSLCSARMLESNPSYQKICRQLDAANKMVEHVLTMHHEELSTTMRVVGGVSREVEACASEIEQSVQEVGMACEKLTTGFHQHSLRELWCRKLQYAEVLRLLDQVEMVRDAPTQIEHLLQEKRYFAAANLWNAVSSQMWGETVVSLDSLTPSRDKLLHQKEEIVAGLESQILAVLFLCASGKGGMFHKEAIGTGSPQIDVLDFVASLERRLERMQPSRSNSATEDDRISCFGEEDLKSAKPYPGGSSVSNYGGFGRGNGLEKINTLNVTEELEASLCQSRPGTPEADPSLRLAVLVEAARRLNSLGSIGTHLVESLQEHLYKTADTLQQTLLQTLQGKGFKERKGKTVLVSFLMSIFGVFLKILKNMIVFEKLLTKALNIENKQDDIEIAKFHPANDVWQHIQHYLINFLGSYLLSESGDNNQEKGQIPNQVQVSLGGSFKHDKHEQEEGLFGAMIKGWGKEQFPAHLKGLFKDISASFQGTANAGSEEEQEFALCQRSPYNALILFRSLSWFDRKVAGLLGHKERAPKVPTFGNQISVESTLMNWINRFIEEELLPIIQQDSSNQCRQALHSSTAFIHISPKTPSMPSPGVTSLSSQTAVVQPVEAARQVFAITQTLMSALTDVDVHLAPRLEVVFERVLRDFLVAIDNECSRLVEGSEASRRVKKSFERLQHSVLKTDVHYRRHKRRLYGGKWIDEQGFLQTMDRVRKSEVLEDQFNAEMEIQKDLWNFDANPYPVDSRNTIADAKRLTALGSLAYSYDWLGAKLYRGFIQGESNRKHSGHSTAESVYSYSSNSNTVYGSESFPQPPPIQSGSYERDQESYYSEARDSDSARSNRGLRENSISQAKNKRISETKKQVIDCIHELSKKADECLLILRIEMMISIGLILKHYPYLGYTDKKVIGNKPAEVLGHMKDLNKTLLGYQEAFSVALPPEAYEFVVAIIYQLIPYLLVYGIRYFPKTISEEGLNRLNRIVEAVSRNVVNFAETNNAQSFFSDDYVAALFERVRQYIQLLEKEPTDLIKFMQANQGHFTQEEFRTIWERMGSQERRALGSFEDVWDAIY